MTIKTVALLHKRQKHFFFERAVSCILGLQVLTWPSFVRSKYKSSLRH